MLEEGKTNEKRNTIMVVNARYAQPEMMSYMELLWNRLKDTFLMFIPTYQAFRTRYNKEFIAITDPIIEESFKKFPRHNERELVRQVENFCTERQLGLDEFMNHCKQDHNEEIISFFRSKIISTYKNLIRNVATSRSIQQWKKETKETSVFVANRNLVEVDIENACIRYTFDGEEYKDDIIIENLDEIKPWINQFTVREIKIKNFETIRLKVEIEDHEE